MSCFNFQARTKKTECRPTNLEPVVTSTTNKKKDIYKYYFITLLLDFSVLVLGWWVGLLVGGVLVGSAISVIQIGNSATENSHHLGQH